jgi:hypothetical protein
MEGTALLPLRVVVVVLVLLVKLRLLLLPEMQEMVALELRPTSQVHQLLTPAAEVGAAMRRGKWLELVVLVVVLMVRHQETVPLELQILVVVVVVGRVYHQALELFFQGEQAALALSSSSIKSHRLLRLM